MHSASSFSSSTRPLASSAQNTQGLKELSETDRKHIAAGEETTVDRTRRLFYVSCTRALKDLAVVLFTTDPEQAAVHLRQLDLFEVDAIHTTADFDDV